MDGLGLFFFYFGRWCWLHAEFYSVNGTSLHEVRWEKVCGTTSGVLLHWGESSIKVNQITMIHGVSHFYNSLAKFMPVCSTHY